MAEVVDIPHVGPSQGGLAREKSSLDTPVKRDEHKAIEKVALKGTVIQKKPSFFSRLKETFIAEDARDVGDYILWDILVPTIKRTIRDIIVGSADRVFLGTGVPSSSSNLVRERGVTRVVTNYSASTRTTKAAVDNRPRSSVPSSKINFGLNEIVFDHYEDAASVLERLVDYLDTYGQVSVDDYFDLIGKTSPFTTQRWGWTSLASATIVNTVGGYFIKLPNPIVIKD